MEAIMMLSFTLPNGTAAGIVPTAGLEGVSVEQLGLRCLTPADEVPVVFYVSSREALNRVKSRFGLTDC
jgi:hypothetical protein